MPIFEEDLEDLPPLTKAIVESYPAGTRESSPNAPIRRAAFNALLDGFHDLENRLIDLEP